MGGCGASNLWKAAGQTLQSAEEKELFKQLKRCVEINTNYSFILENSECLVGCGCRGSGPVQNLFNP